MLRTRKLEPTTCATCKAAVSLVQINGTTIPVEVESAIVGGSLIVLEIHRCPATPRTDPNPPRGPSHRARRVV